MSNDTPLHSDLRLYVEYREPFTMLRHPFVFSVPYFPNMNDYINKMYLQKKGLIEKSLKTKHYDNYIFLHERPYRLQAFLDIENKLSPKKYWELLAGIWVDSENIWQNKAYYKYILGKHPAFRHYFMSKEDKKVYDSLPEQVVVYRGFVKGRNKTGFSYTLDKETAEWFAKRFGDDGEVIERIVPKNKIVAYTDRRGEKEVIIL